MDHQPNPNPYPWDELHQKWQLEQITVEQAVGQFIVWGEQHGDRLTALERELENITDVVADLNARLASVEIKLV